VTDLQEIDRLDIEQKLNDPEFVYLWFDSYFFASKKIIPTSIDIKRRFGVDSPTYSSFATVLSDLFAQVGMINRVNVKFANWQRYLEVVYGDKPQGTKLFIDHTYLATLSKLLIYFRISGGKPITKEEVRKLIFGDIFKVYGLMDLIEEDFFTWFFYKTTYEYSTDLVFKLSKELQIYDLDALDEDVLKELYQELVGTEVRHALGEYYTPDWLAERIVSELVNSEPTASFLDPACGSGTFLFSIINQVIPILKKKGFSREKILCHILDNIVGVDINPLAVIIARTNYLLALKEVIKSRKGEIRIPIYLSDTIKLPELTMGMDSIIPYYKMPAQNKLFAIPELLVKRPILMDNIMEKMNEHAKTYQETMEKALKYTGDTEKLRMGLVESFDRSIRVSDEGVRLMLSNNMKVMFELIDSGNDSIWSYILKNILRPIALKSRKFRFVIGNPPWIAIQFMMNSKYKSFLKEETFKFNLIRKNETHFFSHIEMATLFFCKISDLYLEDGGKIAFVMPKSVLTARHHANFIKLAFKNDSTGINLQFRLEKIFNLEDVNPLFNVPSCVLIADKGAETVFPVKMISMSGLLKTKNDRWIVAKSHLTFTESDFMLNLSVPSTTGSYYELFFNGATIYPRNFWFISFITHTMVGFNPNLPYVRSDKDNDTKKPWDKVLVEGIVEVESLYATLIGRDILPFGHKRVRPVVLPIIIKDNTINIFNSTISTIIFAIMF